jgi:SET domain-containing protein
MYSLHCLLHHLLNSFLRFLFLIPLYLVFHAPLLRVGSCSSSECVLQVRKSVIHGGGLFARDVFEKNEMIVEYIGQQIRQAVADRREAQYEEEGVGSCYLFRLDKECIIDATRAGGMARFMNHSCEPNAYAKVITTTRIVGQPKDSKGDCQELGTGGGECREIEEKHIIIMAMRDILEDEEITYDYKFPIEEKKLKCYCGASTCLGSMN